MRRTHTHGASQPSPVLCMCVSISCVPHVDAAATACSTSTVQALLVDANPNVADCWSPHALGGLPVAVGTACTQTACCCRSGVIATEVGYSQGTVEEPTYEDVCSGQTGHVEVVQVTYNAQEVRQDAAASTQCVFACNIRHQPQQMWLLVRPWDEMLLQAATQSCSVHHARSC
jgi:hypothetical protein